MASSSKTASAGGSGLGEQRLLDGERGALVTGDCSFEGYTYAIDIRLSCGDERFDEELRLHTFKRHSHKHKKVFNDQLLSYREGRLWFDGYAQPHCIWVDDRQRLRLTTDGQSCTPFIFELRTVGHSLRNRDSSQCVVLSAADCGDHKWTGGKECGGVDHRYLPLSMGACDRALAFSFVREAEGCADEFPEQECF